MQNVKNDYAAWMGLGPGGLPANVGGWLITTAMSLAHRLASELDDTALPVRRPAVNAAEVEPHDPVVARRVASATAPLRGAA